MDQLTERERELINRHLVSFVITKNIANVRTRLLYDYNIFSAIKKKRHASSESDVISHLEFLMFTGRDSHQWIILEYPTNLCINLASKEAYYLVEEAKNTRQNNE